MQPNVLSAMQEYYTQMSHNYNVNNNVAAAALLGLSNSGANPSPGLFAGLRKYGNFNIFVI